MRRLVLIGLFLEIGVVLLVVPWSAYWERNYFSELLPGLQALLTNDFIRGAISGLGLLNLFAGVAEFTSLVTARRDEPPTIRESGAADDR